ncbi:hypothetical protein DNTS_035037 [Danionella cerebrum]|uniref:DNA/RNA-binding protein Alba-like domain-containing protein n=1 Tax=Danionella cerebrum TaxID=2873325 RepID=A0A553MRM0_9TELE|nr:hypothetical protein DNTS_035037 [Danionella translucida]
MFTPSTELPDCTQSKCTASIQLKPTNLPRSPVKAITEGYRKVAATRETMPCPIPGVSSEVLEMRVKEGSKIRNILNFAMSRFEGDRCVTSQVLFSGTGRAMTKTITCAEIMKRKVRGLHQVSKIQYRTVTELWENQDNGALQITIHKTLPCICILLSREPLDPLEPGYQAPSETHHLSEAPQQLVKAEKRISSSCEPSCLKRAALGLDVGSALYH